MKAMSWNAVRFHVDLPGVRWWKNNLKNQYLERRGYGDRGEQYKCKQILKRLTGLRKSKPVVPNLSDLADLQKVERE